VEASSEGCRSGRRPLLLGLIGVSWKEQVGGIAQRHRLPLALGGAGFGG
jgi:hypothetical protein